MVAEGAWPAPDRFTMTWRFVETAFCDTVTLQFGTDELQFDRTVNTNAGSTVRPTLRGRFA